MSWLDLLLLLLLATATALGAQRRASGLALGIGAVVLFRPLLALAEVSPFLVLAVALLLGGLLSFAGRLVPLSTQAQYTVAGVAGGLGGFLLGLVLILSMVVSLPIQRNLSDQIVYPPRDLPAPFARAVASSQIVDFGRDILLYPLLDAQGQVAAGERFALERLHGFLVIGEPWNRR